MSRHQLAQRTRDGFHKSIALARTALQRSESFAEALQSHINGLYAEFVAMGDPIQRAGIEKKRNEAIAEQDQQRKHEIGPGARVQPHHQTEQPRTP
jgi:hypothetical protein